MKSKKSKTKFIPFSKDPIDLERISIHEIKLIHEGIKRIASFCDGAHELDGCGFNKNDTEFGKSLASSKFLTKKQASFAARLCYKYRRQLEASTVAMLENLPRVSQRTQQDSTPYRIILSFGEGLLREISIVSCITNKSLIDIHPEKWKKMKQAIKNQIGMRKDDIDYIDSEISKYFTPQECLPLRM